MSSDVTGMWQHDLVTLTLTLGSRNRKMDQQKNKKEILNKKASI